MYIETDLTNDQKITLQKLFRRTFIEPHVVAQQLRMKRAEAIALLDRLVQEYPKQFTRKYLIYHICSEAPVASMPDTKTINQGWTCPECEEEAELDGLTLDFAYSAIAPVDFLSPDDGLVRYWGIDYFPYYSKACQNNPEPMLALSKDDAEIFDKMIDREADSREKSLLRVEQEYRDSVCAIAEDLIHG